MTQTPQRPALVRTHQDNRLQARIVLRQELKYASGADPSKDWPAFVRAASGLAMMNDELVVIQDDASFLAFVPAGPGGRRRFEDALGNKLDKLDLESVIVVPWKNGSRLLAFGSGSLPARERILSYSPSVPGELHLVDASPTRQ